MEEGALPVCSYSSALCAQGLLPSPRHVSLQLQAAGPLLCGFFRITVPYTASTPLSSE